MQTLHALHPDPAHEAPAHAPQPPSPDTTRYASMATPSRLAAPEQPGPAYPCVTSSGPLLILSPLVRHRILSRRNLLLGIGSYPPLVRVTSLPATYPRVPCTPVRVRACARAGFFLVVDDGWGEWAGVGSGVTDFDSRRMFSGLRSLCVCVRERERERERKREKERESVCGCTVTRGGSRTGRHTRHRVMIRVMLRATMAAPRIITPRMQGKHPPGCRRLILIDSEFFIRVMRRGTAIHPSHAPRHRHTCKESLRLAAATRSLVIARGGGRGRLGYPQPPCQPPWLAAAGSLPRSLPASRAACSPLPAARLPVDQERTRGCPGGRIGYVTHRRWSSGPADD